MHGSIMAGSDGARESDARSGARRLSDFRDRDPDPLHSCGHALYVSRSANATGNVPIADRSADAT